MNFIKDYIKKSQAQPYEKRVKLMWSWVAAAMAVVVIIWIFTIPGRFRVESGKLTLGNFISQIKEQYTQATAQPTTDTSKTPKIPAVTTQSPATTPDTSGTSTSTAREQSNNDVKLSVTNTATANNITTVSFTITSTSDQLISMPKQSDVQIVQLGTTDVAQTLENLSADSTVFPTTLLSSTSVNGTATFSGITADQPYQLSFNNIVVGTDGQPFSFAFNY